MYAFPSDTTFVLNGKTLMFTASLELGFSERKGRFCVLALYNYHDTRVKLGISEIDVCKIILRLESLGESLGACMSPKIDRRKMPYDVFQKRLCVLSATRHSMWWAGSSGSRIWNIT
jgi:hypothetical protein